MWFHHVPWDRRMSSGRPFWDELVYRYQMGVQYVTWMRETWDTLEPCIGARRFSEVKAKLAQHETDAASWRDTSVSYWREFSGRDIPVDGGPLSAKIIVDGKERRRLQPVRAAYTIPVAAGGVAGDHGGEDRRPRRALRRSSRQATERARAGDVKVTKDDFFGPIVKNYVFNLVPDTTLRSLQRERQAAGIVQAGRADLQRGDARRARTRSPKVEAVASDPAATVSVEQATTPTGQAKVTVTNGSASTVYTVNLDTPERAAATSSTRSARSGRSCGRTTSRWRVADGSLVITLAERRPAGHHEHRQEPRPAGRQRRLDGGVQARLLPPAGQQQRAGRDHRLQQRPELRQAGVGDEQRHAGDQQAARGGHPRAERHGDDVPGHGRGRAEDRRRRRRDLAAARKPGNTYKAYYSSDGASGATSARRRSTSSRPRPGWSRSTAAATRPISTSRSTTSASPAAGDAVPALAPRPTARSAARCRPTLALTLGAPARSGRSRPASRRTTRPRAANVISTARDATLSVADPSATATGRLVNGAFALPQPLQVSANGGAFAPVGGSAEPDRAAELRRARSATTP